MSAIAFSAFLCSKTTSRSVYDQAFDPGAAAACEFVTVCNGAEALDFVGSRPSPLPDLMILDCNVPKSRDGGSRTSSRRRELVCRVDFHAHGSLDPTEIERVLGWVRIDA